MPQRRRVCKTCGEEKLFRFFKRNRKRWKKKFYFIWYRECKACHRVKAMVLRLTKAKDWQHKTVYYQRLGAVTDETITTVNLLKLISLYPKCPYCLKVTLTNKNLSFDHMEPLGFGGRNTISNIIVCCLPCNQLKSSYSFNNWFDSLPVRAQNFLLLDDHCQVGWAGV